MIKGEDTVLRVFNSLQDVAKTMNRHPCKEETLDLCTLTGGRPLGNFSGGRLHYWPSDDGSVHVDMALYIGSSKILILTNKCVNRYVYIYIYTHIHRYTGKPPRGYTQIYVYVLPLGQSLRRQTCKRAFRYI